MCCITFVVIYICACYIISIAIIWLFWKGASNNLKSDVQMRECKEFLINKTKHNNFYEYSIIFIVSISNETKNIWRWTDFIHSGLDFFVTENEQIITFSFLNWPFYTIKPVKEDIGSNLTLEKYTSLVKNRNGWMCFHEFKFHFTRQSREKLHFYSFVCKSILQEFILIWWWKVYFFILNRNHSVWHNFFFNFNFLLKICINKILIFLLIKLN